MSLTYHVVRKKDMRPEAPEGAQLYYGQIRINQQVSYQNLCEEISQLTLLTEADVSCILDGLLFFARKELLDGNLVDLGILGSFRMTAGAPVVDKEEDFHPSMFRKGRIVFTPGIELKKITQRENIHYVKEKFIIKHTDEECKRDHVE
ncbi:MAG: hypothetical protein LUH10_09745 [Tannerellaceae bacterium]|nr:hypothetical protein [Tannerellaceae bacterium]